MSRTMSYRERTHLERQFKMWPRPISVVDWIDRDKGMYVLRYETRGEQLLRALLSYVAYVWAGR